MVRCFDPRTECVAMARDRPLLILIFVWALGMIVPDLVRLVQPLGSVGFYANSDGVIYDVAGPFTDKAASPASKAGIREGDRIDLPRMSCHPYDAQTCASVLAVLGGLQYVLPGRAVVIDFAAMPDREARQVTLVAAERPTNWLVRVVLLLDSIAGILVVAAAGWLVWSRPGRMSWGFFLYAVWLNPGQSFVFYAFLQQWPILLLAQNVAGCLAQGAAYAGLLLFVLRAPNNTIDTGWRPLERALPLLAIVFALASLASYGYAFGYRTETLVRATLLAGFAVDLAALVILLVRRRSQSPEDYQRMRWMIWGCAIGLPTFIIAQLAQYTTLFTNLWGATPPYDILGLLFLANGIFCLFVFQAIRRTRVVSVSIPLRRVTLLGLTLSIPALLLHNQVELIHDHLQLPNWAWLGIAVVVLYLISRLHELAVEVADRFFNQALDRTESALSQAILGAAHAEDIDRVLSDDPFRVLQLASAATFRRTDAAFDRREDGNGWDEFATRTLYPDEPMLAALPKGEPFDLDTASNDARLPSGLKRPILAIPVANRVRCFAVALYGPHVSGTDLDSNERAMLARLGDRAADCYAELENEDLRTRIAALEHDLSARISRPEPDTG
jgi:hypothetical protein